MRILVTGAAGFIGSHLVDKLLSAGHTVHGIDNLSVGSLRNLEAALKKSSFKFSNVDIRNKSDLISLGSHFEAIAHLAALADIVPSMENPQEYFECNVDGTFNVMQYAKEIDVRKVIYIASSSCYGIPDSYPTSENAEIRPQYPYALTKFLGECIAMHWSQIYGIPVTSLRLFNVYGPRARTSGTYGAVFGVFLAQKIAGKPYTVVGDGTQTRDFTYVSDVVNAIYKSLNSNLSGIFNIGSGKTYSVNKLVELLQGEVVCIPKRPGEPDCTFADISKVTRELGWKPDINLEDGVKVMLENIQYWSDAPIWDPVSIGKATSNWFKYLGRSNDR
jgi:UDP-glucose 4-epimerase